jgi:hypothetical protein
MVPYVGFFLILFTPRHDRIAHPSRCSPRIAAGPLWALRPVTIFRRGRITALILVMYALFLARSL